jgi:putative Holliday junction resolvase
MKILSVDLGKKRTGLAVCDNAEILASPVCTVIETNFVKCCEKVAEKALELEVGEIVVGKPLNMDGTSGESAKRCEDFARLLEEKSGITVKLLDERRTTILANVYLNNTDTRGKKRKEIIDSVAAVIILEDYLKLRKNNLV